jgi:hypothetical protein
MKTNSKTSISVSVLGNLLYPGYCRSLSVSDSLNVHDSYKTSSFEFSIVTEAPTIKQMLRRVMAYNSSLLTRLSSVSRLCSTFFTSEVYPAKKELFVINIDYMYNSYSFAIPFIDLFMFLDSFSCDRTSANILNTLNFYSLKYPYLK